MMAKVNISQIQRQVINQTSQFLVSEGYHSPGADAQSPQQFYILPVKSQQFKEEVRQRK